MRRSFGILFSSVGSTLFLERNICMKKFTFALLLTACVGTGALAQAPVGVVQDVQGLVTVSQDNKMGNLVKGLEIVDGAHVVTTTTGTVDITLDNGCRIHCLLYTSDAADE